MLNIEMILLDCPVVATF